MNLLEIEHLTMRFGGLTAVQDFNLSMEKGEIVGLIGPNGSGKSTVFNIISGFYNPTKGKVTFSGKNITGFRPDRVTANGVARIFQNSRLFRTLSAIDNVLVSTHFRLKASPFSAVIHAPGYKRQEKQFMQDTMALMEGMGLTPYLNEPAGKLPYGLQRRLEVARALATRPKLLLLDEPATGMTIEEAREMMNFILQIRGDFDLTILLIEHTMAVVMGSCPRILVLNYGKTIAEGTPTHIQNHPDVIQAYLGDDS